MKSISFPIYLVFLVLFISCDDFIERDISKEQIKVNAPLGGNSDIYTQTFWWDEVKGASNYRLQIVYNRFDSLPIFRLDTLVRNTKFTVTLRPDKYQWRLWAENGSSRSDTIYNLITIDSASIIKQQVNINRTVPDDDNDSFEIKTNLPTVTFYWDKIEGASGYIVEVMRGDSLIIASQPKPTLSYKLTMDLEGIYTVTVKAQNAKKEFSLPSELYTVNFDKSGPEKVDLISPKNDSIIPILTNEITLAWKQINDVSTYQLFVDKDMATLGTKTPTQSSNSTSFVFNRPVPSEANVKYYWMVIGVDVNGNKGVPSEKRSFTFQ